MENKLKDFFREWLSDNTNKAFLVLVVVILIYTVVTQSPAENQSQQADVFTADTVIPEGYVLVPIEIQNKEALQSLVGAYALVDLFTVAAPEQKGGIRVGKKLKILRAPLKPDEFAVLVNENETESIMQWPGPFMVVIQNRDSESEAKVSTPKVRKSKITYHRGA